ncbi:hypothetical protein AACH06_16780 [Ideonella sp. DXS29W]|uniref:Uncharacterized protein n=1 Tax=Ideonella lacteola TaxID=2984193 RepID=A0ABU9BRK8_9BURK
MNLSKNVTGMTETHDGVDVDVVGPEIRVDKMQAMANKCAPGGPGCEDDCCEEDFKARLKGVKVDGIDGNVTMHVLGAIKAAEVANNLSRCNCYDKA